MVLGRELSADLALAVLRLRRNGLAFVWVSERRVLAESRDPGLAPLVRAARRLRAARTADLVLADRVVGTAALVVACWAGVRAIHAEVASEGAHQEAQARGVALHSERRVPHVLNRRRDGLCPFEAAALRDLEQGADLDDVVRRLEQLATAADRAGPARSAERGEVRARVVAGAGIGAALAVLLPVLFHGLGLGPAFLPMHLPVLLTGALFGPGAGLAAGGLAPVLSSLLTGMPPLAPPVAQLMVPELAAYGASAGLLRRRWAPVKVGPHAGARGVRRLVGEYAWLCGALVTGRLALALAAALLGPTLGLRVPPVAYVKAAVVTGLPGLVVQIVVVPVLTWQLADRLSIPSERGGTYGTADAS